MAATPKKPTPKKATAKPAPAKTASKPAAKPSGIEKIIQDVTNRYRVTAREARDIVTAVGTAAKGNIVDSELGKTFYGKNAKKNLTTQIGEAARAAVTGKKGTESDQIVIKKDKSGAALFKGQSRNKSQNAPGRSVTDATKKYQKGM